MGWVFKSNDENDNLFQFINKGKEKGGVSWFASVLPTMTGGGWKGISVPWHLKKCLINPKSTIMIFKALILLNSTDGFVTYKF